MLHFSLLGSGSAGNATYIQSRGSRILIDNGLSFKQLKLRMDQIGADAEQLDAVFITHEHGDHVKGAGVLARKIGVPIYFTPGTYKNLSPSVGEITNAQFIESGETVQIGGLEVASFGISHDAADPVSYTVRGGGAKLGFATDLGHVTQLVRTRLKNAHALILEANHCPDMLRRGPYPPQIQQRIRSRTGHLSNQDMCSLLDTLLHDGLQQVVLIHLSAENNSRSLVRGMATQVLRGHPAKIVVAAQDAPTPLFEIKAP